MNQLKKYIPLITLFLGLFLGYFLFSDGVDSTHSESQAAEVVSDYTCSMHPQIHLDKPGKCPICGMDLIPASSVSTSSAGLFSMSKEAQTLAKIETAEVKKASLVKEIYLPAELTVDKSNRKQLSFQVAGRVEKLNLKGDGQAVKKGEILLEIYAPDLTQMHRELVEAKKLANKELIDIVKGRFKKLDVDDETVEALEKSEKVWDVFPVKSPISGVLTQWQITEKQTVNKGQNLAVLDGYDTFWVQADVFQSDIPLIKTGQKAEIMIGNSRLQATVDFIDRQVKMNSRTQKVQFTITNTKGLYPGMTADVQLEIHLENSLVIPKTAVLWTGKRSLVYVAHSETEFELVSIETGFENGIWIQVLSGLQEGQKVVSKGVFKLDSEAQLAGKVSMMTFEQSSNKTEKQPHSMQAIEVSKTARQAFESILAEYLTLKDALVASDVILSKKQAEKLQDVILRNSNEFAEYKQWNAVKTKIKAMVSTQDLGLMRAAFIGLSEGIIAVAKHVKPGNEVIYVQFCPMADNNKGANWLSKQEEIRNPYYGNMMLTCGEVVEKIESNN